MKKELLRKKVKDSGLKSTALREEVLQLFMDSDKALRSKEIIDRLGDKYDRVSIFRTLSTFAGKGIIHSIPTSNDYVVYSLCRDDCDTAAHHDHHYHFFCHKCGDVFCLNDFDYDETKMPGGYKIDSVNIIFEGLCKECNQE